MAEGKTEAKIHTPLARQKIEELVRDMKKNEGES